MSNKYTVIDGIVKWVDKDAADETLKGTVVSVAYSTNWINQDKTKLILGVQLPSGWYSAKFGKNGNNLPMVPLTEETLLHFTDNQPKSYKSLNEFPDNIKAFVPTLQLYSMLKNKEISEQIQELDEVINIMPETGETDGVKANDKIVFLHYFNGNNDWYIVEKDFETEQKQAYGYVILNGDKQMAEWGYVDIEALKKTKVEIDLYFTPVKFGQLMEKENGVSVDADKNQEFIFGEKYGVPAFYGQKVLETLESFGFEIKDVKSDKANSTHEFKVSKNNSGWILVNDNGGEFNILDETKSHLANIPYDTSEGVKPFYYIATDIEKEYDQWAESKRAEARRNRNSQKSNAETIVVPSVETATETSIVESEIETEVNSAPLEEIEIQNPQIQDLSYVPASESCRLVDTIVPASMRYDLHKSIETIDRRVNGVDDYVAEKLGYVVGNCTFEEKKAGLKCLCEAFSAEQVDAIAVAIYNIEEKGQGCIIGDATGIGKGRIAAGMLRYGMLRGLQPIFLTEKPNLFSDLYRDLIAIGSDDAIPIEILTGYKEVEKRAVKKEDDTEDDTEDSDVDTITEKVDIYEKNKIYPSYSYKEVNEDGVEINAKRSGKNFVKPFIVNGTGVGRVRTDIKDEQGNILYRANNNDIENVIGKKVKSERKVGTTTAGKDKFEYNSVQGSFSIPKEYNVILATYSQFRGAKPTMKMEFLSHIAKGNIVVMDESHNASGDSNTGKFLSGVLSETLGVTFLSATFAKRPDNMPIYATKTALSDANLDTEALISAISRGGVALQEIVSSGLVSEGQMIRRERSFEGIETNYQYLDSSQVERGYPDMNLEVKHRAIMDNATSIIREIMNFQKDYVNPVIEDMDNEASAEYGEVSVRKGTTLAGIDNQPVFSGIFNIINQLLFSIKAESVADAAIQRLREGKKPIIAFSSTMESFLDSFTNDDGLAIQAGDKINSDFSKVLEKRLKGVLRYTVTNADGNKEYESLDVYAQDAEFVFEYERILKMINKASIGICSSPIDVLIDRIESAGFSVLEVTGRNRKLKFIGKGEAKILNRMKIGANDAFRQFNNNETDCLLINQSGSTGASAHALPNKKVPKDKVRQRVMIILQAELNINTEVQKRGRINRTGQILKPIYDYIISAIPAEKRLMIMLQKKLKSLDANTTSNQKQSERIMDISQVDFLNKIGDQIVYEYLLENPLVNQSIGDPLKMAAKSAKSDAVDSEDDEKIDYTDAAQKVTGRVAILSCKEQEQFYTDIGERYISTVEYLIQSDQYDLEVKDIDLNAETISKDVVIVGKGGDSVFGRHSILEKVNVKNTKKPYKKAEIDAILQQSMGEFISVEKLRDSTVKKYEAFIENSLSNEIQELSDHYSNLIENISKEKQASKAQDIRAYIKERTEQLESAKDDSIARAKKQFENKSEYITRNLQYFHVGRVVGYPTVTYSLDNSFRKAIFLGFQINENQKNPYAPSSIKARFAVASSQKYVAVPLSKYDIISNIKSITSTEIYSDDARHIMNNWDDVIAESSTERTNRYVVTGNILQAYGNPELMGSLISYTTNTGGVKKGILLPDGFTPNAQGRDKPALKITVPIMNALPLIKSMSQGSVLKTKDEFSIQRAAYGNFNIAVPVNKKTGGQFYLNETIQKLTTTGRFDKSGSNMLATVEERKIDNLIEYLQSEFSSSVELTRNQFDTIKGNIVIEDYDDEVKHPQSEVFIEKLTQVDKEEEDKIKHEAELKAFEAEQQKRELEIADAEAKKKHAQAVEDENRILAFKNKLLKLSVLLHRESRVMAKGGAVDANGELDKLKTTAYNLGVDACVNNKPRVPAQNSEFMEFMANSLEKHKANAAEFQLSIKLMKAFENGYYNQNEKELRLKFPDVYKPR